MNATSKNTGVATSTYRKSVLENGLRVVTDAIPSSRSISIGVLVAAGPFSEGPGQSGLAHLCEHLLFQGTSNRSALDIARLMDGAGGRVGGFTSRDYTGYFAVVTDEFMTYALDLLGDVLLNPIFPTDALSSEQRAICCEIEAANDDPEQQVHHLLKGHVWAGHPLGRSITGQPDDVRAQDREALIYFLHRCYLPERMVVAAAGRLDHDDLVAHVRDAFWRLLATESPLPPPKPAPFQPGLVLRQPQISQAYFALAIEAPAYTADNRFAVHVLTGLLGGGISSRLYRSLRDDHGLVYTIQTSYQAYREAGLLLIEGATLPANLQLVVAMILDELHQLGSGRRPVDEEELIRSKAQLRAQMILSGEDSHSVMSRAATQELYFGRHFSETELLAEIDAVDFASLLRLVENELHLAEPTTALAVVAPELPEAYNEAALLALLNESQSASQATTHNHP